MDNFALERVREYRAGTAIVLGSGLNSLVPEPSRERIIPYAEVGGLPRATVKGHLSRFVLGEISGTRVVFAQGRAHLYEGRSAREVAAGVRFLARAGIERLILTNAAGAVNPDFSPGSWMMLTDHLNLTGATPLLGERKFVDLTDTYSPAWRERFARAAQIENMTLHKGVYAGLLGPQYETPAEVRMLRILGADAVGMSTVHEAIQARALGLEVAAFSCLVNWAAGMHSAWLSHDEVLATGQAASKSFVVLLASALNDSQALPEPR